MTVTVSGHATDASLDQVTAGEDGRGGRTDVTLAVASTDDAAYNGISAGSVVVSINDNDTEGVTVSETSVTIVEGSSGSYTVVLNTQPAGDVTVTVSGHAGTDDRRGGRRRGGRDGRDPVPRGGLGPRRTHRWTRPR